MIEPFSILGMYGNRQVFERLHKEGFAKVTFGSGPWIGGERIVALWTFYHPNGTIVSYEQMKFEERSLGTMRGPWEEKRYAKSEEISTFKKMIKTMKVDNYKPTTLERLVRKWDSVSSLQKVNGGYKIKQLGFENVFFTESCKEWLDLPQAIKFASKRNGILQSLREAIAFRIEENSADYIFPYQITRTSAIYFVKKGIPYVAFEDSPDVSRNIVLSRVVEGYETNKTYKDLLVSFKDKQLKDTLIRAERADRIHKLPLGRLELSLDDYAKNDIVCALEGDIAQPYANFLKARDKTFKQGLVYLCNPNTDEKLRSNEELGEGKIAVICPVALGGDAYGIHVNAHSGFRTIGQARGVRNAREFTR